MGQIISFGHVRTASRQLLSTIFHTTVADYIRTSVVESQQADCLTTLIIFAVSQKAWPERMSLRYEKEHFTLCRRDDKIAGRRIHKDWKGILGRFAT